VNIESRCTFFVADLAQGRVVLLRVEGSDQLTPLSPLNLAWKFAMFVAPSESDVILQKLRSSKTTNEIRKFLAEQMTRTFRRLETARPEKYLAAKFQSCRFTREARHSRKISMTCLAHSGSVLTRTNLPL
jgi:hypothetical protein